LQGDIISIFNSNGVKLGAYNYDAWGNFTIDSAASGHISTDKFCAYSNLQGLENVAPGKDFTASQKTQIIQQNKINNHGVVKSDLSGQTFVPPQKSMKGVTPSPNEWQIDHIIPKSAGGPIVFLMHKYFCVKKIE